MAVSNIEWKDVATVVEPAVAKCLNPGLREVAEEDLTEEDRTFFVVRKRPEGAAVKYWRSSQDYGSYTCRREPYAG